MIFCNIDCFVCVDRVDYYYKLLEIFLKNSWDSVRLVGCYRVFFF